MSLLRSSCLALVSSFILSACVPDPALVAAGLVDAPAPRLANETVYGSVIDAGMTIPAVPAAEVPDEFQRQTVYYETDQLKGTIVINPGAKYLYLVTGRNQAVRYGIAVGRAGFLWSGEAVINERKTWPTWTPPEEMIERKPELTKWVDGMPGGLENPLGARALYLTTNGVDYGYRIHGTPEWFSIGKNASSGCIRMINQDVLDLYGRVADGAKVIVLNADGSMPNGLTLPPPQPKKEKPKPSEVAVAPPVVVIPPITLLPPPNLGMPVITPAPEVAPAEPELVAPVASQPAACLVKNADGSCLCPILLVNGICPIPAEN